MNLNINPINFNIKKSKGYPIFKQSSANLERSPKSDSFEISIGYVNDIHGQTNNMMRVLSGLKGDLKVSAGDNDIGDEKNVAVHNATVKFLNIADIKASALGNHEIDPDQADFIESIKKFNGKILALNFNQVPLENQNSDEVKKLGRADMSSVLQNSEIVEVKGEKVGLLGASPMDMFERLTHPNYYTDCSIEDLDKTVSLIQEEISKLKESGVNKVILLSHLGYQRDKYVAENTDGVDVIIGGHTHELLKDIKEGENLFYSKAGEPVIITEAGRDGNYFGKLNLTFDNDGVIKKAQNNLGETRLFYKNMINQYVFEDILGKPEYVGTVKIAPPPPKSLLEENPHANFVCDIMRETTDSDIALWHHCGVRSFFHEGVLNSSEVKDMSPFLDYVVTANVSEKALVDGIKSAIEVSYNSDHQKPGLIAVSGLTYTVDTKNGTLKDMTFIDKNNKLHKIDVSNPRENKFYKVVTDEFLMSAGADFNVFAKEEDFIKTYPYDKDVMICDYIKQNNEPVVINQTGRIKYVS